MAEDPLEPGSWKGQGLLSTTPHSPGALGLGSEATEMGREGSLARQRAHTCSPWPIHFTLPSLCLVFSLSNTKKHLEEMEVGGDQVRAKCEQRAD